MTSPYSPGGAFGPPLSAPIKSSIGGTLDAAALAQLAAAPRQVRELVLPCCGWTARQEGSESAPWNVYHDGEFEFALDLAQPPERILDQARSIFVTGLNLGRDCGRESLRRDLRELLHLEEST